MATKKPKKKNPQPTGMSPYAGTQGNFNPMNDPEVGIQSYLSLPNENAHLVWEPSRTGWERKAGESPNQWAERINAHQQKIVSDYQNASPTGKDKIYATAPLPAFLTEGSAWRAAPHAASISNTTGAFSSKQNFGRDGQPVNIYDAGFGYVPKAEFVAPADPNRKLGPREQQLIKDSAANVAARESGNTPAHNAAYRAQTYQKEADRKRAAGDTQSADRWARSAAEERAKAKQLGYKGDFKNLSATQSAPTPKPAAPAASPSAKPADQPAPSANAATSATDSVKATDNKYTADKIKADMKERERAEAARNAQINKGKVANEIKDLNAEVKDFREVEQRWRDRAAKADTPEKKEHALQMAAEYADKAKDRENQIADKQKGDMKDIKPLSSADKDKGKASPTDPMSDLMANIPSMNNSSAYGTGGGATGFFTRDGKVIPITA